MISGDSSGAAGLGATFSEMEIWVVLVLDSVSGLFGGGGESAGVCAWSVPNARTAADMDLRFVSFIIGWLLSVDKYHGVGSPASRLMGAFGRSGCMAGLVIS